MESYGCYKLSISAWGADPAARVCVDRVGWSAHGFASLADRAMADDLCFTATFVHMIS